EEKAQRKEQFRMRDEETRLLTALEAATAETRLVLLGDPGSGKSTFVRQLCARLAANLLGMERAQPSDWEADLLPIYTELRDLPVKLATVDLAHGARQEQDERLVQALFDHWRGRLADIQAEACGPALLAALESGQVFVVFDGLDEAPVDQRALVRRAVHAIAQLYPRVARIIVTCRVRSYSESIRLSGYSEHRLAPFTNEQISDFCSAWYDAQVLQARFEQAEAGRRAADLRRAALAENLAEMAANPMLLTTMAIVHQKEIGLPDQRVKLYSLAVEVLMERWQSHRGLALPAALAELLTDTRRLRKVLERLAYEAQSQRGQQEPDLPRSRLLTLLEEAEYLADVAVARDFLDYVDHRAGLLVGRGGAGTAGHPQHYAFPHRTFQEYLAGCHLLRGRSRKQNFRQKAAEQDAWTPAARLGAEELFYNNPQSGETDLLDLVYALCPAAEPQSERDWRALVWSAAMAADLLGRTRIERDREEPDGGEAYLDRLVPRLVRLATEERLLPVERADGGRALGKLGDPRPGVGVLVRNGVRLPDIDWVPIEAGPFVMGSDKQKDPRAFQDEFPQFTCTLITQPYRMGRYPITVAQYACFVDGGGYRERDFWTDAGWDWVQREGIEGPDVYRDIFQTPNHPQVGVSWYEAMAFCRWLSEALGQTVTLPSEAQWERAARFTDGRIYPWNSDFAPERCNMGKTGIQATSAVGLFPSGVSQEGVLDMSGNVWEWCRTKWRGDYKGYEANADDDPAGDAHRVVRGGSWYLYAGYDVRCAVRYGSDSNFRDDFIGFRVMSPGL
ncbi:MAG: SUMF1/EgtB/PvdO family nonheme iron enzyme, partial [Caldilineaceae bacterium]|nr:SUMF1/EgtB/PvdO family nonheme iron enzyme [Caldilineaceae bacterium]